MTMSSGSKGDVVLHLHRASLAYLADLWGLARQAIDTQGFASEAGAAESMSEAAADLEASYIPVEAARAVAWLFHDRCRTRSRGMVVDVRLQRNYALAVGRLSLVLATALRRERSLAWRTRAAIAAAAVLRGANAKRGRRPSTNIIEDFELAHGKLGMHEATNAAIKRARRRVRAFLDHPGCAALVRDGALSLPGAYRVSE
jgi:hypothetical protein